MTLDEDAMRTGIAVHCAVAQRMPRRARRVTQATLGSVERPWQGRLAQLVRAQPSHG